MQFYSNEGKQTLEKLTRKGKLLQCLGLVKLLGPPLLGGIRQLSKRDAVIQVLDGNLQFGGRSIQLMVSGSPCWPWTL